MWATVHLSKDEDCFRRIFQIMEVQKIQTVFETVQAQISYLKLRDPEVYGLSEHVDWTDGHWRRYSLLDKRNSDQVQSTVFAFSDPVLCLGGK